MLGGTSLRSEVIVLAPAMDMGNEDTFARYRKMIKGATHLHMSITNCKLYQSKGGREENTNKKLEQKVC